MKQWSVLIGLAFMLSLASWLVIYRVEGTRPSQGLTVMIVGVWLVVASIVRRLRRSRDGR